MVPGVEVVEPYLMMVYIQELDRSIYHVMQELLQLRFFMIKMDSQYGETSTGEVEALELTRLAKSFKE